MSNYSLMVGYASQYYTLWKVFSQRVVNSNGVRTMLSYQYVKNISKDRFEVKRRFPMATIDETITSKKSFEFELDDKTPWLLKSGKYCGKSVAVVSVVDPAYIIGIYAHSGGALRDSLDSLPLIKKYHPKSPPINHVDLISGPIRLLFELPKIGSVVGFENHVSCVSDVGNNTNVVLLSSDWKQESGRIMPKVNGRFRDVYRHEFVVDVDVIRTVQTEYNRTYFCVEK